MSLLHLVRHGQASAGTDNYDRLSEIGKRQSEILGQWWSSHAIDPQAAFHGSLTRQQDTAALSLSALDKPPSMKEAIGLNEYDHRVIESHFSSELDNYTPEAMSFDNYLQVMSRWRDQPADSSTGHFESWQEFRARGLDTLRAHTKPDSKDTAVFFTSGGVIATVLSSALNLDFEHTIDAIWRIRNTSITSFHMSRKGLRLIEFNAIPHLLEHRDPSLVTLI